MYDLSHSEAVDALCRLRMNVSRAAVEPKLLEDIVQSVGGRLSYLNRVCQSFVISRISQNSDRWQGQKT